MLRRTDFSATNPSSRKRPSASEVPVWGLPPPPTSIAKTWAPKTGAPALSRTAPPMTAPAVSVTGGKTFSPDAFT
jgi:hypothetical protein